VAWLADPAARASAHVIIGRDGGVVQMVDFNRKAWHAGQSAWGKVDGLNQCSIGIELVNVGKVTKRKDGKLISWSNQVI
ncbi:N-acetylmuramoyl-L-alanine amidase, partial [Streptococcus pneumoniae]|nr:N-acetylmuramoyl-L-alanine amidase [Streptococcus pneumoniae]